MFRISLIVSVLLTLDVTAKYLDKLTEEAWQKAKQEAIVSLDEKGKMLWVEEVEPPEEVDEIQYIIDPRMKIWKSMADSGKQPPMPEEDRDDLNHPSLINLHDQNEGFHSVNEEEPLQGKGILQSNKEAVQDKDDIYHPDVREVAFHEPEQDLDEIYHKAWEQLAPLMSKSRKNVKDGDVRFETDELVGPGQDGYKSEDLKMVRLHLEPEEDLDALYHKDISVLQQNDPFPKAAVPIEYPSQRRHTAPEEDLDDIHHQ